MREARQSPARKGARAAAGEARSGAGSGYGSSSSEGFAVVQLSQVKPRLAVLRLRKSRPFAEHKNPPRALAALRSPVLRRAASAIRPCVCLSVCLVSGRRAQRSRRRANKAILPEANNVLRY